MSKKEFQSNNKMQWLMPFMCLILTLYNAFLLQIILTFVLSLCGFRADHIVIENAYFISLVAVFAFGWAFQSKLYQVFATVMTGARRATNRDLERLEPLVNEVLERANSKYNMKIKSLKVLMQDNLRDINAFALGDKYICFNTRVLKLSDEEIKGLISHEIYHLIDGSGKMSLIINGLSWLSVFFIGVILAKIIFITKRIRIVSTIILLVCILPIILYKIGFWLAKIVLKIASRSREFDADYFACELGYSRGHLKVLEKIGKYDTQTQSFKRRIEATHPPTAYRIEAVDAYIKAGGHVKPRITRTDFILRVTACAIVLVMFSATIYSQLQGTGIL